MTSVAVTLQAQAFLNRELAESRFPDPRVVVSPRRPARDVKRALNGEVVWTEDKCDPWGLVVLGENEFARVVAATERFDVGGITIYVLKTAKSVNIKYPFNPTNCTSMTLVPNLSVNTDAPPAALRAGRGSPVTLIRYAS
jgi:hypothetical protein